ncbi:MAG: nuclease-related domain-containing protein [Brevinemataceae bacterium]
MAKVNENIVAQYISNIHNWFYIPNILIEVPSGYSDIDLLAYNPKNHIYYDIEVKFRSAYTISNSENGIKELTDNFLKYQSARDSIIYDYTDGAKCIKILVTTYKMFGSEDKRKSIETQFINIMSEHNYESQIWYFDNIIKEFFEKTSIKGKYTSEFQQTIRMIKTYMKET